MINEYIALDVETTGLNPARDKLLEIGAVRVQNGVICATYVTLVDGGTEVPERIEELTGITDAMRRTGKKTAQFGSFWNSAALCRWWVTMCHLIMDF